MRKDDRDGWTGSDGVADKLERRQGSSGTLPQSRETKKEAQRTEESCAWSGETWQGFPSFVCLAQGCSARGNQEMSKHSGGGRGQAPPRLRQKEGKVLSNGLKTLLLKRTRRKKRNQTSVFPFLNESPHRSD